LITIEHELETARQIQSFILPREMAKMKGLEIAARYVPMAMMAGDFYDFLVIDDSRIGILVADVSGHGVPASLIASMVKIAFVSQTPNASDPARVLAELNQILCGKLESDFVTAGYLYIDTGKQTASYAGAGHPPLLIWRQAEQKIFEFRTGGVVLGQFDEAQYEAIELNCGRGDRFFLYTDGIVEASNMSDELFGWERFKACIISNSELPSDKLVDKLIEDLNNWAAKGSSTTLDDDLTLVVVDVACSAK
jgi:serine phosphatase RsbU (regulator of sigma subunit)